MGKLEETGVQCHWLLTCNGLLTQFFLGVLRRIWVETEKNLLVDERILLLGDTTLSDVAAANGSECRLDFGRVDKLSDIWLRNGWRWKEEILLECGRVNGGSVDLVESLESAGCPDNESSKMSTWCELEKVEGVDGGSLNTSDVSERLVNLLSIRVWVVDYEGSTSLTVTATS